ncbi:kinase-like domain-containing protein [Penicillium macrosclerotiorum]|uniref:kinase-like domain-containing protein n=1 Tax=Penicillium macrosclerotiorum TaxID=303699 RepID=UPI0025499EDB|nr:kinase-like domain-containing protein [Penicillium macrosclerotiorum]KAJ5692959.1 kinase-like domain-containing protein [Penicillium macrosclerotiorum]
MDKSMHGYSFTILFYNEADPGYNEKGRDLNRFCSESNAYKKIFTSGGSDCFHPAFQHFAQDKLKPRAVLLEYLPKAESLNCVKYSDALYPRAIEGMEEIHSTRAHHQDIYSPNLLLIHGNPDRLVWIDFDVAITYTNLKPEQKARRDYEIALVKGLGDALRDDQDAGLLPNTKFY